MATTTQPAPRATTRSWVTPAEMRVAAGRGLRSRKSLSELGRGVGGSLTGWQGKQRAAPTHGPSDTQPTFPSLSPASRLPAAPGPVPSAPHRRGRGRCRGCRRYPGTRWLQGWPWPQPGNSALGTEGEQAGLREQHRRQHMQGLHTRYGVNKGMKVRVAFFPFLRSKRFGVCPQIFQLKCDFRSADGLSSGYSTISATACPVGVRTTLVPALMILSLVLR